MSANYKYWAFISYCHKDKSKADYIGKIISKYKLPKTLKDCYIQMPDDLNPIFIDNESLCAGAVNSSLDEKLKLSKNLVVISTENSIKSEWVDYEIGKYKTFNKDCTIIPVIFESEPVLNKGIEKDNLVAIPFTKELEKKSTCRLIASCLGNGIEPYQVQRKNNLWKFFLIGIFAFCFGIAIGKYNKEGIVQSFNKSFEKDVSNQKGIDIGPALKNPSPADAKSNEKMEDEGKNLDEMNEYLNKQLREEEAKQ